MDNYRYIFNLILLIMTMLAGCSSSNDDSSDFNFQSNIFLNKSVTGTVKSDTSNYFTLDVEEGVTYTVLLTTLDGDADLAVRDETPSKSIEDVIVYSITESLEDYVIFTALFSGTYFVEVNGFVKSRYTLVVQKASSKEVDIHFSDDTIIFSSVLPSLMQSGTNLTVTGAQIFDVIVTLVGDDTTWMNYKIQKNSVNNSFFDRSLFIDILTPDKALRPDIYNAKIRVTRPPSDPSVYIFRDIAVEYHVLNANIPTSINSDNLFDVNIESPENSSLQYSLAYSPAGMSINNGKLFFSNNAPLFQINNTFNYGIQITVDAFKTILHGSIDVVEVEHEDPVVRTNWTLPENITAGDFDNDGENEIFIGLGKKIYTIKFDGNDYVQDWVYPYNFSDKYTIEKSDAIDINNDGFYEFILIASAIDYPYETVIFVLDGVTREIEYTAETGLNRVFDYQSADLDNDGSMEAILLSYDRFNRMVVQVISLETGNIIWGSDPGAYGINFEIGNLDVDADLEIVTESGHVIDTTNYSLSRLIDKNIFSINLYDLDSDGVDEIIYNSSNKLKIFNVVDMLEIDHPAIPDIYKIYISDVDDFPGKEIFVSHTGSNQFLEYEYSGSLGLLVKDDLVPPFSYDFSNAIVFDFDNDGTKEMVKTLNSRSTAPDKLQVASGYPDVVIEWENDNPSEFIVPFLGGVEVSTSTGEPTVAFLSSDSYNQKDSSSGARLLLWNDSTKALEVSPELDSLITDNLFSVLDYDKDFIDDLVVGQNDPFLGNYIAIYNIETYQLKQKIDLGETQGKVSALTRADVNQDGYEDVIVMTSFSETTFNGTGFDRFYEKSLWVYDLYNQSTISNYLFSNRSDVTNVYLEAVDLENDGGIEVIITYSLLEGDYVDILSVDQSGEVILKNTLLLESDFIDLAIMDVGQDNVNELIILIGDFASRTSSILTLNKSLDVIVQHDYNNNYRSIFSERYGDEESGNVIVSATSSAFIGTKVSTVNENNYLLAINPENGFEVWRSPFIIGSVERKSLSIGDLYNNGEYKMFFSTEAAIYVTQ